MHEMKWQNIESEPSTWSQHVKCTSVLSLFSKAGSGWRPSQLPPLMECAFLSSWCSQFCPSFPFCFMCTPQTLLTVLKWMMSWYHPHIWYNKKQLDIFEGFFEFLNFYLISTLSASNSIFSTMEKKREESEVLVNRPFFSCVSPTPCIPPNYLHATVS